MTNDRLTGDAVGLGLGDGLGVAVGAGVGVGLGEGLGVGVGVGGGVGVATFTTAVWDRTHRPDANISAVPELIAFAIPVALIVTTASSFDVQLKSTSTTSSPAEPK